MKNASLNPPKRYIKLNTIKMHTNKDNNTNNSLITEDKISDISISMYQLGEKHQIDHQICTKMSNNGQI